MVDEFVVKAINAFIAIGKVIHETGSYHDPVRINIRLLAIAWDEKVWDEYFKPLDDFDLICLIKGATLTKPNDGSVSPVIAIFRYFRLKTPESVWSEVADWVLANTKNPYLPFGTMTNARSYNQYKNIEANKKSIKLAQDENAKHAEEDRILRAQQRLTSHAKRKTSERYNIIADLQNMPLKERFVIIASDDIHSVNFYPTKWAREANEEFISTLDDSLRVMLAKKMKGKQKGPWSSFKKRLLNVTKTPWSNSPWSFSS